MIRRDLPQLRQWIVAIILMPLTCLLNRSTLAQEATFKSDVSHESAHSKDLDIWIPVLSQDPTPPPLLQVPNQADSSNPENSSNSDLEIPNRAEAAVPLDQLDPTELFERVFGQSPASVIQQVIAPFRINGEILGEVLVFPSEDPDELKWQAAPVLTQIAELITSETHASLEAAVDSEGNLRAKDVKAYGVIVTFDIRELLLSIEVPSDHFKTNTFSLRGQAFPSGLETALRPSPVSGYLNLQGAQEWVWGDTNRPPLRLNVEGVLNIHNWVFESRLDFTEGGDPAWLRGDLRVIHDHTDTATRLVLGDLSIPIQGYQSSQPMAGITWARNYSLQPYLVTRPVSNFEFFLESPSRVEIFVNGQLEQILELPAGPQDIRDLTLRTGSNQIELVITDDVGRVERLNFSQPTANELLADGLQQFAVSLGVPSENTAGSRYYDWSQPTLTASYRWALTQTLTLGPYLQTNPKFQLLGTEGIAATKVGSIAWDIALSQHQAFGSDYVWRFNYLFSPIQHPDRSFELDLEYQGANFISLSDEEPNNDIAYDLTLNYRQILFKSFSSSLNLRYQWGRETRPDTYGIALRVSKPIREDLNMTVTFNEEKDDQGDVNHSGSVNLIWTLREKNQRVQTSTVFSDQEKDSHSLIWTSTPEDAVGLATTLELKQDPDTYGFNSRLNWTGYRFKLDLINDLNWRGGARRQSTRLNFATAIAYAGGHWSWSRPINQSFAMVVPHPVLKGQRIGLNPSDTGTYEAKVDEFGSAIISNLSPYRLSNLTVEIPELPLGYDGGNPVYTLLPSYRSGTLITLGSGGKVTIRGTLTYANGDPVTLKTAELRSLSDPNQPPILILTNRSGKFAQDHIKPGMYEIKLIEDQGVLKTFEILDGSVGLVDLDQLAGSSP